MALYITNILLIGLLGLAVFFDLTQKRIPNFLTFPAIILGLTIFALSGGWSGVLQGFAGFGIGIAIFFIPFALGGMGAGDVKLMGAIGALKGMEFILYTALFTALCGGLLALTYLLFSRRLFNTLKKVLMMIAVTFFKMLYFRLRNPYFNQLNVYYSTKLESLQEQQNGKLHVPYGVAIAMGAFIVLMGFAEHLIHII